MLVYALRFSTMIVGSMLAISAAAQDVNPVGVWSLRSMTFVNLDTGKTVEPWGAKPVGQLTYSANGRMIAVLTADPTSRKPATSSGPKGAEERADLYNSSAGYSGTWSISGATATHKVDMALNAAWVGTNQVRYLALDGDDLTIDTAPVDGNDGSKYKIRLVWKRVP